MHHVIERLVWSLKTIAFFEYYQAYCGRAVIPNGIAVAEGIRKGDSLLMLRLLTMKLETASIWQRASGVQKKKKEGLCDKNEFYFQGIELISEEDLVC